jgi:hypothetical protein
MESVPVAPSANTKRKLIAPGWHTVLVLVPIAIGSIASAYQHGLPNANLSGVSSRLSSYFTVLVEEWFVVLLIWLELRRHETSIGSLVSGRWQTLSAFFKELRTRRGISYCRRPADRSADAPFYSFFWGQREFHSGRYHAQDSIRAPSVAGNGRDGRLLRRNHLSWISRSTIQRMDRQHCIRLDPPRDGLWTRARLLTIKRWLSSWPKDGSSDCLPSGARACARECWPTGCKMPSAV